MMKIVIAIALVAVSLQGIQSKSKPKSLNKVPCYELEKSPSIKGTRESAQIQTNDVLLYENDESLKNGKVHIESKKNQKLYVNGKLVLDQLPKAAPIAIPNPHLKADHISSFTVDLNSDSRFNVYTLKA